MTIFAELKKDHKTVKALCQAIEKEEVSPKKRLKHFLELANLLSHHTYAEEEAFYDRLKPAGGKTRDLALEGYEEHHVADFLLSELKNLSVEDERWTAKFTVLKESLEHHIEEEEQDMFAAARKKLSKVELEQAAKQFLKLKKGGDSIPDKHTFAGAQRGHGTGARA